MKREKNDKGENGKSEFSADVLHKLNSLAFRVSKLSDEQRKRFYVMLSAYSKK